MREIPLNISQLDDLQTSKIGNEILLMNEGMPLVDQLRSHAEDGDPEGLVIVDGTQGLRIGLMLRPKGEPQEVAPLQLIFSLCISKAFSTSMLRGSTLNWPGDVEIDGDLAARVSLFLDPENVSEGYLIAILDLSFVDLEDPDAILRDLLCFLDMYYSIYLAGGATDLLDKWTERSSTVDSHLKIDLAEGSIEGKALGVDQFGSLIVKDDEGLKQIPIFDLQP